MIKQLHTIAYTHRNMEVAQIGNLHIESEQQKERFEAVKIALNIDEILFLSTCNRVEFFIVTHEQVAAPFLTRFFQVLYPNMEDEAITYFTVNAEVYHKMDTVNHALRVASSIDSLVVGEREIITQVRQAFEQARDLGLSGDALRVLFRHTIETAKKVFTETKIALKPVSIVSIAYQRLQGMDISTNARVLVVGTGVTNTTMVRFLKKHGLTNFTFFNRTLATAENLAHEIGGKALPLADLERYSEGFDLLVACTGADSAIITPAIYQQLLQSETAPKITIDLGLPSDIDPAVHANFPTRQISIDVLQKISTENLGERAQEVAHVEAIIAEAIDAFRNIAKMRAIEIAMRPVPQMVKDIKSTAFNEVFKNDLQQLDPAAREVLEKVVGYMEKKYMNMPMLMAKDILFKS
uniref:glutamyl-tRNA reductase n=1 Tax=Fluviicola sp. TaxID=1917219 RepID=UPI00404A4FF1